MEILTLMRPDPSFREEIISYRAESLEAEGYINGAGGLDRFPDPADWLEFGQRQTRRETLSPGWVPSTQFIYVRDSDRRIVGLIHVRHEFNQDLERYGGNIGYSVRPSERKKGYAKRMLADCLAFCKESGLERVLITCRTDNEGSRRTILANGGVYQSTVYKPEAGAMLQRYWIELT